jgi:hypothetical protein
MRKAVERPHQIFEAFVFERTVVHTVVVHFLCIVRKTRHGQESDPVIGRVVGGPRGNLISELHPSADNKAVPRNHLVEMAGFDGHVMKLRLAHRAYLPFQRVC